MPPTATGWQKMAPGSLCGATISVPESGQTTFTAPESVQASMVLVRESRGADLARFGSDGAGSAYPEAGSDCKCTEVAASPIIIRASP